MTEVERQEKIDEIVDRVDDWDLDVLINYAKSVRRDEVSVYSDETLDAILNDDLEFFTNGTNS